MMSEDSASDPVVEEVQASYPLLSWLWEYRNGVTIATAVLVGVGSLLIAFASVPDPLQPMVLLAVALKALSAGVVIKFFCEISGAVLTLIENTNGTEEDNPALR